MRLNIFSGARRIAIFIFVLASIATIYDAATFEPQVNVNYDIEVGRPIRRTETSCSPEAKKQTFFYEMKNMDPIQVNLCLLWIDMGDGERVVPFEDADSKEWFAVDNDHAKISEYADNLESQFVLPPKDISYVTQKHGQLFWKNALKILIYWICGIFAFYALIWSIGWIVRGFLGIPRGADMRPN